MEATVLILINKTNYPGKELRELISIAKGSESLKGWTAIIKNGVDTGLCKYGKKEIIVRIHSKRDLKTYWICCNCYYSLDEEFICDCETPDVVELVDVHENFHKDCYNWQENFILIMGHEVHHKREIRTGIGTRGHCHVRCNKYGMKRVQRYRELKDVGKLKHYKREEK